MTSVITRSTPLASPVNSASEAWSTLRRHVSSMTKPATHRAPPYHKVVMALGTSLVRGATMGLHTLSRREVTRLPSAVASWRMQTLPLLLRGHTAKDISRLQPIMNVHVLP